jgi:hypothetical protein
VVCSLPHLWKLGGWEDFENGRERIVFNDSMDGIRRLSSSDFLFCMVIASCV